MKRWLVVSGLSALVALSTLANMHAQGSAFTYQGFLRASGNPANANYDFQFSLWTTVSGGSQVGATQTRTNVPIQNGLFTVSLDFGTVWDGSDRFLQIAVRPSGSGSYTTLSPRVKINPTPYAIRAGVASPIGAAGGDLSGGYPNPTVAGLQGRSVSDDAPSSGQVLKWNGSAWAPAADDVGGLTLPFWGSANVPSAVFQVTNTAPSGFAFGVYSRSASTDGRGVYGEATATSGVTSGVYGVSRSPDGRGVFGVATATSGAAYGVFGRTNSPDGRGVYGEATATSGAAYGVFGRSNSPDGRGVYGEATATNSRYAYGVYGQTNSEGAAGVFGVSTVRFGYGVGVEGRCESVNGMGMVGRGNAVGVYGESSGSGGRGVVGRAIAFHGESSGVYGQSISYDGRGVYGEATATTGRTYGVFGRSNSPDGRGVYGEATATTGINWGVYGESRSASGTGVAGLATATSGMNFGGWFESLSNTGFGVHAWVKATSGTTYGVYGRSDSAAGYGVYAFGRTGATGTKSFQIDHPLRPETHYLNHFCTESPEPMNTYSGNVVTDAQGYATIQLPDYFESINHDFRYQLTVIDDSNDFVLAKVVRKIQNNQFVIRTSKPFVEVSWEVKAIRNDLWVQRYGYQTEQEKPKEHQGKYLHPELHGQPKERGIHYYPEPTPAPSEKGEAISGTRAGRTP